MVYLLHFSKKYKHAGHYLGSSPDDHWKNRIEEHRRGQGARLTQVVVNAGIDLVLAVTWPGNRDIERKLKAFQETL